MARRATRPSRMTTSTCRSRSSSTRVPPRTSKSALLEEDVLSALPEHQVAELLQAPTTPFEGREMVACELPHPAGEEGRAVGKEDFGLADPARVEEKVARRRV